MLSITLRNETTITTLQDLGQAVVLESTSDPDGHHTKPYYFDKPQQAAKFIISNAYALITIGFEVVP